MTNYICVLGIESEVPRWFNLILAFCVGFIGSGAYITVLLYKFVGDSAKYRRIIAEPFIKPLNHDDGEIRASIIRCIWYCVIGGLIASIFQYDVPNFVAVQSLILGATWPAIVSQFLSGRMSAPTNEEKNEESVLSEPNEKERHETERVFEKVKDLLQTQTRKKKK